MKMHKALFLIIALCCHAASAGNYGLGDVYNVIGGSFPYIKEPVSKTDPIDRAAVVVALGAKDTPFPADFNPNSDDVNTIGKGCIGLASFLLGYNDNTLITNLKMPDGKPMFCFDNPISAMEKYIEIRNKDEALGASLRILAWQYTDDGDYRINESNQLDPTKIPVTGYHFLVWYQQAFDGKQVKCGWINMWNGAANANTLTGIMSDPKVQAFYTKSDPQPTGPDQHYFATAYCLAPIGPGPAPRCGKLPYGKMEPTKDGNAFAIPTASVSGLKKSNLFGVTWDACTKDVALGIMKRICGSEVAGAKFENDECKCGGSSFGYPMMTGSQFLNCSPGRLKKECQDGVAESSP